MKKIILLLSSIILLASCNKNISSSTSSSFYSSDTTTSEIESSLPHVPYDNGYYENIYKDDKGSLLSGKLHDLICDTHIHYTTYKDNGQNELQRITDADINKEGNIIEFYSGVSWPGKWAPNAGDKDGGYNREHCWCQSLSNGLWGETGGGADMHHLRPVETRLNSTRNNSKYGYVESRENYKKYAKYVDDSTYALGGYKNNDIFEPIDSKKGDIARILFYTYIHYNDKNEEIFENHANSNGNASKSSYFGHLEFSFVMNFLEQEAIQTLLLWNENDPVDEGEIYRNNKVEEIQGNRNPFIDYPNMANLIWES